MDLSKQYESVLRRAELFSYIADLVKNWPETEAVPTDFGNVGMALGEFFPTASLATGEVVAADTGQRFAGLLPRIKVIDRRVICNGAALDLARRPLTLRLFQAFCAAPEQQLTRDELLQNVYGVDDAPLRSERYLESTLSNGVKLISRARMLAATHLGRGCGHGVEWFVYDQERRVWCLYRLRTRYLSEKLG